MVALGLTLEDSRLITQEHQGVTPQKTWPYVRFSNRLKALWADRVTAREMRHRVDRVEDPDILQDVFDGGCYKDLLQRDVTWKGRVVEPATRYFDRDTDVALGFASDGILMVQRGSDSCWPVILTVFNLPPELRTKREFQICCGLIPGKHNKSTTHTQDSFPFLNNLHCRID